MGGKEKPVHERDLDSLLRSIRNYTVPGQSGHQKLDDIQNNFSDELSRVINSYLAEDKEGPKHGYDDEGNPKKRSIGDKPHSKDNYKHAKNLLIKIGKFLASKVESKKIAEEMSDDMALTYLGRFGINAEEAAKDLAQKSYKNVRQYEKIQALFEKGAGAVSSAIVQPYQSAIEDNKAHLSELEKRAKKIHDKRAEWAPGLENGAYLTHIIADMVNEARTPENVRKNKEHFKNWEKLRDIYTSNH